MINVYNMRSERTGKEVPNQFKVICGAGKFEDGTPHEAGCLFQSYDSSIAFRDIWGKTFLDAEKWDYSRTTGRYRNQFLEEGIAETRKKIASGEYTLVDMN